jgi:hypothetical protein
MFEYVHILIFNIYIRTDKYSKRPAVACSHWKIIVSILYLRSHTSDPPSAAWITRSKESRYVIFNLLARRYGTNNSSLRWRTALRTRLSSSLRVSKIEITTFSTILRIEPLFRALMAPLERSKSLISQTTYFNIVGHSSQVIANHYFGWRASTQCIFHICMYCTYIPVITWLDPIFPLAMMSVVDLKFLHWA